jgi:hypothetical protein
VSREKRGKSAFLRPAATNIVCGVTSNGISGQYDAAGILHFHVRCGMLKLVEVRMTQIAVDDTLVNEAVRLSENSPVEEIVKRAFKLYIAQLSARELRGTMHWDDSGDWTENAVGEVAL